MVLFWRNGYRGVSLDDLTRAMEITRPSLYGAFGDKERLFLQAVDHYRETVLFPPFNCSNRQT
ncbi:MAG: TetR/AcrR family transcriptional regulator [Candidatus Obscuribacterales bacterium]